MLTSRRRARWLTLVVIAVMAVVGVSIVPSGSASAAMKTCLKREGQWDPVQGRIVYRCTLWSDGKPGTPGKPGTTPTCDLKAPATFCRGTDACFREAWGPPWAIPPGTKPPGGVAMVETCLHAAGGSSTYPVWVAGGAPPLAAQAQEAVGNLQLPTGTLAFSPAQRAVVGLPTWFWVTGVGAGPLTGSSAFGLVAIATPDHLEVDPGDGSAPLRCPWTTSQTAAATACAYAYRKASVAGPEQVGGQPAYRAGVTAVWAVAFRDGGAPVTIPGAPTEVRSPVWVRAVPVAEVQAISTLAP